MSRLILSRARVDRPVLQAFAHAIEQHNGYGFGVFSQEKGANGSHRHEHKLAEEVAFVLDLLPSLAHHGQ